jgi:hypothetical protein
MHFCLPKAAQKGDYIVPAMAWFTSTEVMPALKVLRKKEKAAAKSKVCVVCLFR